MTPIPPSTTPPSAKRSLALDESVQRSPTRVPPAPPKHFRCVHPNLKLLRLLIRLIPSTPEDKPSSDDHMGLTSIAGDESETEVVVDTFLLPQDTVADDQQQHLKKSELDSEYVGSSLQFVLSAQHDNNRLIEQYRKSLDPKVDTVTLEGIGYAFRPGSTKGVTIVVSPLLSLMTNHVDALQPKDVDVLVWNSETVDHGEVMRRLRGYPKPSLLYVSPEKIKDSGALKSIFGDLYRADQLARLETRLVLVTLPMLVIATGKVFGFCYERTYFQSTNEILVITEQVFEASAHRCCTAPTCFDELVLYRLLDMFGYQLLSGPLEPFKALEPPKPAEIPPNPRHSQPPESLEIFFGVL
ncbi:hypothetical protein C8R42DRAFT_643536 [Lentinula raphanica]|nr:hypothetical protein C8R42DRAFT_643536 [Lentinula raphanica]